MLCQRGELKVKNAIVLWLIIAAVLVITGAVMFIGVMMTLNWDFSKLSTVKYETNSYFINDGFKNISINTNTADVVFLPSDDGACRIVCDEEKKLKHTVSVSDGVLTVSVTDTRKWYEYIGISWGTPKITVYLPDMQYGTLVIKDSTGDVEIPGVFGFDSIDVVSSTGDVSCGASVLQSIGIKLSTGDICIENLSAGALALDVSTGNVAVSSVRCEGDINVGVSTGKAELTDVRCKRVISDGSTGDISLKNTVADDSISIRRSTGDVYFENSDAAEIFVNTSTGNVNGSLLSDKVFITETDTGRIKVPKTITGGRCEVVTDTGNIILSVNE